LRVEILEEGGDGPEGVGGLGTEFGEIEGGGGEVFGDFGEEVAGVVFGVGGESVGAAELVEKVAPMIPGGDELGEGADAVEFVADGEGGGGGEGVRIGVGDAGGEVVGFVDEEESPGGIEAGLFEKEAAVARGEDVVVVADPDVVEGEGGAGDFVGTDAGGAAGGAEGVEVAGVFFVEIETREARGRPTGGGVGEVSAGVADAVKRVVDAVFGFVADVPGRDGSRGELRA